MLFLKYKETGKPGLFLLGPVEGYQGEIPRRDEAHGSKSKFDFLENNFHHVSSDWYGLSLTDKSLIQPDGTLKLDKKNSVRGVVPIGALTPCIRKTPQDSIFRGVVVKRRHTYLLDFYIYYGHDIGGSDEVFIHCDVCEFRNSNYTRVRRTVVGTSLVSGLKGKAALAWCQAKLAEIETMSYESILDLIGWKISPLTTAETAYTATCSVEGKLVPPRHHPSYAESAYEVRVRRGDLSLSCVNQVKSVGFNALVSAIEAPELATIYKSLPKGKKSFRDPKWWSSLYLTYAFGVAPVASDVSDLKAAGGKRRRRRLATQAYLSTRSSVNVGPVSQGLYSHVGTSRMKLKYYTLDDPRVRTLRFLYDFNLMPTLDTAWELVPFSFVADWCAGIDRALAAVDYLPQYATLETRSVVYSDEFVTTGPPLKWGDEWVPLIGTTTDYLRVVVPTAVEPIPKFGGPALEMKNLVSGAALIIQRAKK